MGRLLPGIHAGNWRFVLTPFTRAKNEVLRSYQNVGEPHFLLILSRVLYPSGLAILMAFPSHVSQTADNGRGVSKAIGGVHASTQQFSWLPWISCNADGRDSHKRGRN